MKITVALINKLIRLRDGGRIPSSQLHGDWVEGLLREGVLVNVTHGSHRTLYATSGELLVHALKSLDERMASLEGLREVLLAETSRAQQAAETGNSKLVPTRACPGFPVNTFEPIPCRIHGADWVINPPYGSFCFVSDWRALEVPKDVTIVGVENMENFRRVRDSAGWLRQVLGEGRLLFVSRYPQSKDLAQWLLSLPNDYVHFGDFDLAGIHIFLTEFRAKIGDRASFLIPEDIETRLRNGSRERYDDQYMRFRQLRTEIVPLQGLIDLIHKYHRCYDQEGYIGGDG